MPRLLPLILILLVTACGAITIEVDTLVKDENDITHDISLVMSGPIATMALEEVDDTTIDPLENEFFAENCEQIIDEVDGEDRIKFICSDITHQDLLSAEQDDDDGLDIQITKTDLGDKWEYRATSKNIFHDVDDELEDNPFAEGMSVDAIIKTRYYWTLTLPGEIVETNANSSEEGQVKFIGKIGDEREEFVAVSHKEKPKGLFGICN